MFTVRGRRWLAVVLCASGVLLARSEAAGFWLPPIEGELAGEFAAVKLAGAPTLQWRVKVEGAEEGRRRALVAIDGAGTKLRIEAVADAKGDGNWWIREGELELEKWFPVAVPEIGEAAEGVAVNGVAKLSGGGELFRGQPGGVVNVSLTEATVRNEADGWMLEGVRFSGEFRISAGDAAGVAGAFEAGIRTITTSRFGARSFSARGRLNENGTVTLAEARVEIAGGEVVVDPATVPLSPLALDINMRVINVGLQDVAALVPASLSDARGRIDGAVRIEWSEAEGFQLGVGELRLGEHEPAAVRLAATPGFLTDRVPRYFELIPPWAGPVARWVRPKNPAYDDMEAIELGRTELRVESLRVRLTPDGDERGRTASVSLTAHPMQASSVVEKVTFEINVSGPLRHVLKLGMEQPFSLEVR
jgi:Dicarboxylate transport.